MDPRHAIARRAQRLTEEVFGSGRVPFSRKQKVDRLTGRVHSPVEIFVFTLNLYIGLVGAVAFVGGLQMWAAMLVQLRCLGLHPAPDATGIHFDAAFRQKFRDMFVSQGIPKVPADTQKNHLTRKMAPLERIR
jgi:hypothetical protein